MELIEMSNVDLMELVRSKVKGLKAYQVENLDEGIKLHANENPYPPSPELLKKNLQILDKLSPTKRVLFLNKLLLATVQTN
jgi:histidinol-phosphate/aromatic aminotransferase/cobyric acid decarboxylase-like protein